jgi:hypothetical protein
VLQAATSGLLLELIARLAPRVSAGPARAEMETLLLVVTGANVTS